MTPPPPPPPPADAPSPLAEAAPRLAGPRCLLRALRLADAPALARHGDDEAVWRNLFEGFPRPYTVEDAEWWCTTGSRLPASGVVWGIVAGRPATTDSPPAPAAVATAAVPRADADGHGDRDRDRDHDGDGDGDGEVIGCIGIRQDVGWLRCNAEVGYWIGRAHWRRGIGGEALRRVTAWAWRHRPELTRLYAPIFSWNEGSQAVARHAGYTLEGTLPRSAIKAGRVIDRVQYAAYRAAPP